MHPCVTIQQLGLASESVASNLVTFVPSSRANRLLEWVKRFDQSCYGSEWNQMEKAGDTTPPLLTSFHMFNDSQGH